MARRPVVLVPIFLRHILLFWGLPFFSTNGMLQTLIRRSLLGVRADVYCSKRTNNRHAAAFSFPFPKRRAAIETASPDTSSASSTDDTNSSPNEKENFLIGSPWDHPNLKERAKNQHAFRSRQHVNPLASKFQHPTILPENWPQNVFSDLSKPLFLDIGCSRGGFLINFASRQPHDYNYLGLEIRPIIAHQAKQRIDKHNLQGHLEFIGCNVNVDLDRLLTLYSEKQEKDQLNNSQSSTIKPHNLQMVTIQFPDPHFKSRHAKRRVVTPDLVRTLAKYMPAGATVFLQSDVKLVLDEMRQQFRLQQVYFTDTGENVGDYVEGNIFGILTEREVSVLEKGLPVYRSKFIRTLQAVPKNA